MNELERFAATPPDMNYYRVLLPVTNRELALDRGEYDGADLALRGILAVGHQLQMDGMDPTAYWRLYLQTVRDYQAMQN